MRDLYSLLQGTVDAFIADRISRKAAALAFYTVFSLAPLLIISIAIAGAFFGAEAARGEIVAQISGLVGEDGARAIDGLLQNAGRPGSGVAAAFTGFLTLVIGATTAFAELKDGLDQIWNAPRERVQGVFYTLRKRVLSFGVILSIGFLLLVWVYYSALIFLFGAEFTKLFAARHGSHRAVSQSAM